MRSRANSTRWPSGWSNYDKLNVERLVYEKSKTEAIIESLEDGVVLIDPRWNRRAHQ